MSNRIVLSAAVVAMSLLVASRTLAGSLDPTNAPGPTMHTLEEIYQKVNNLVIYTNALAAAPKTGQTSSYATDDDGALKKGVAWPNPRFTVQANTNCVLDNLTGLIWARNANMFGLTNWGAAVTNCNNLTYGGQADWRLPNAKELYSLIDLGRNGPALCNTVGTGQWTANDPFTGVQSGAYWSSSTPAVGTDDAWYVYLPDGQVSYGLKTFTYYVWPVRGGQ